MGKKEGIPELEEGSSLSSLSTPSTMRESSVEGEQWFEAFDSRDESTDQSAISGNVGVQPMTANDASGVGEGTKQHAASSTPGVESHDAVLLCST